MARYYCGSKEMVARFQTKIASAVAFLSYLHDGTLQNRLVVLKLD